MLGLVSFLIEASTSQQDILSYLSLFAEPSAAGTTATTAHPADIVMTAFADAETSAATVAKCKHFLEEAMKINGKKLDVATTPDTWYFVSSVDVVSVSPPPKF